MDDEALIQEFVPERLTRASDMFPMTIGAVRDLVRAVRQDEQKIAAGELSRTFCVTGTPPVMVTRQGASITVVCGSMETKAANVELLAMYHGMLMQEIHRLKGGV